jgi:hypothetical protein
LVFLPWCSFRAVVRPRQAKLEVQRERQALI